MASYGYTFTSGDTVTPTKLNNARTVSDIVNADIKSDAAIAGTKIDTNFGSQNVTAAKLIPTGTSATGNGVYLPATNSVAISTDGSERVRIDASGNVGIGTSSPSEKLHVKDGKIALETSSGYSTLEMGGPTGALIDFKAPFSDDYDQRIEGNNTNFIFDNQRNGSIIFNNNLAEVMRINASGNVGIGTNSPNGRLTCERPAGSGAWTLLVRSTGVTNDSGIYVDASNNVMFDARNGAAALTLSLKSSGASYFNGGDLLVSKTATDWAVEGFQYEDSNKCLVLTRSAAQALQVRRNTSNGQCVTFSRDATQVGNISVTTTATAYNTSSDYRLKENPQPMVGALARLVSVNPVTFTWKSNGSQGEGFIAHELQAVVPEAVTGEKDAVDAGGNPVYQGVDASKLVPILVAAVQELSARVAALEAAQ